MEPAGQAVTCPATTVRLVLWTTPPACSAVMANASTGMLPATLKGTTRGSEPNRPSEIVRLPISPRAGTSRLRQRRQTPGFDEPGPRAGQDDGGLRRGRRRRRRSPQWHLPGRWRGDGRLLRPGERGRRLECVDLVVEMTDLDAEDDRHDGGHSRDHHRHPHGRAAPPTPGTDRHHLGGARRRRRLAADRARELVIRPPRAGFGLQPFGQPVPRRRSRSVEPAGDPVPQLPRRCSARVGQQAGHFVMLGHLDRAPDAPREMPLDHGRRLGIHRVEGVDTQQPLYLPVDGIGLVGTHDSAPAGSTPSSARLIRSRPSPDRMRLLTVPSGSLRIWATSR